MTLATGIAVMKRRPHRAIRARRTTIYERPANLFVAGFVGSPAMNFVPCTLQSDGGETVARIGDIAVPLDRYAFTVAAPRGEAILGIRPEHVGLAEDGAPGPTIPAEALFIEPMGADTLGWFDAAGQRISARLQPQRARTVEGRITLALDTAHASIFDKKTEQRL